MSQSSETQNRQRGFYCGDLILLQEGRNLDFSFVYCLPFGNHQAGAQPHLLNALSARLAKYEAAEAADAMANARPSTRGKAQR